MMMAKRMSKFLFKPVSIKRDFYDMASQNAETAEIHMYGDVVQEIPVDWWTGEPIPGDYIALDAFMEDFERVSGFSNIHISLNSYGGDCVAAFVIHNKLRELARDGKHISCTVDGVAMSAASLIMSACDTVRMNPASLVMIHKCWSFLFGGYNADELREMADEASAYDKAIASAYARKTGMSETQILHMMSETTYMTGKEAVEKGFADELIEDAKPLELAASADGRSIFVRGREIHLAPGMFAPDMIATIQPKPAAESSVPSTAVQDKKAQPANAGERKGGESPMTKGELKAQYPELVAEIEADMAAGNTEAVNAAIKEEQKRIKEIDQIASLYPEALVTEAKYGDNACTAQELAYRAARQAAKKGRQFVDDLEKEAKDSGANDVPSAQADPDEYDGDMDEMDFSKAKAMVHKLFAKKEDA